MMPPSPFDYSGTALVRRHGPAGYETYERFKPWLRDEFTFRCVYCLFRERWYPDGYPSFSVDHVIPRSADDGKALERNYDNLVYACNRCNSIRQAKKVLDPTRDKFGEHLRVDDDGTVEGLSPEGRGVVRILDLNHPQVREYRRSIFLILQLKRDYPDAREVHELFVRHLGYPDDLPDLRELRPPGGNRRPNSEQICYRALKDDGKLGEVY